MPDRIIKESICISDTLNQLTDFEERFWHRLTVNCDDYGRFDARPAVLKARLFPLLDGKTLKNMSDALNRLVSVGLVELYDVDGKPFLHVITWDKYQRIRAKRSKFPEPDGNCRQMPSNASVIQSNPIRIQSESESNPKYSAEPETASAPPIYTLPLNTGDEYPITQAQIDEWTGLYQSVDVMQALRNMRGWCLSNPQKRKTKAGILRFVSSWLAREQDRGGRVTQGRSSSNVFMEIAREEGIIHDK